MKLESSVLDMIWGVMNNIPGCYDNPAVGYAVGGGIEHFLTESISMKAEYVYMGFDDYFVDPAYSLEVHSIRGGVAFHF